MDTVRSSKLVPVLPLVTGDLGQGACGVVRSLTPGEKPMHPLSSLTLCNSKTFLGKQPSPHPVTATRCSQGLGALPPAVFFLICVFPTQVSSFLGVLVRGLGVGGLLQEPLARPPMGQERRAELGDVVPHPDSVPSAFPRPTSPGRPQAHTTLSFPASYLNQLP